MKMLTPIILNLICFCANGQASRLSVDNDMPTVGERVSIRITLRKEDVRWLEPNSTKYKEEFFHHTRSVGSGSLSLVQVFSDTGMVTVGPFQFTINNETFVTDVITFRIYPAAPEGLMVQQLPSQRNEVHLVMQQKITTLRTSDKKSVTATATNDTDKTTRFKPDEKKFSENGLKMISRSNRSWSESNIEKGVEVTWHKATFKFEKTPLFVTELLLDEGFFIDFPENVEFKEIWIK